MRRTIASMFALAAAVVLLAACGGDDDDGALDRELNETEDEHVAAWVVNLTDGDDALTGDEEAADCMARSIVVRIGIEVFDEAGVVPADIRGGDSPGELVGGDVIAEADARAVIDDWKDCTDVARLMAESFADDDDPTFDGMDLDVDCLADRFAGSDVLDDALVTSFTSEDGDSDDPSAAIELVELADECADGTSMSDTLVETMAASLRADGSLTEEQALCVAQSVFDAVGLEGLLGIGSEDAAAEIQQKVSQATLDAADECDVPLSALSG